MKNVKKNLLWICKRKITPMTQMTPERTLRYIAFLTIALTNTSWSPNKSIVIIHSNHLFSMQLVTLAKIRHNTDICEKYVKELSKM